MISFVSNPSLDITLGYDVKLGIKLNIPSNVYNDSDYIELIEYIEDAREFFKYKDTEIVTYNESYSQIIDGVNYTKFETYEEARIHYIKEYVMHKHYIDDDIWIVWIDSNNEIVQFDQLIPHTRTKIVQL